MVMLSFDISPISLMRTLTMALDLAVDGVGMHQHRTAIICRYIAEEIGMDVEEKQNLLSAALMHDIGAASFKDERLMLSNQNLDEAYGKDMFRHAEDGYSLLNNMACFSGTSEAVRYHHDRWSGGNPSGLSGATIPLHARIIHLADRIEIAIDKNRHILNNSTDIIATVNKYRKKNFDPDIVDIFMECSLKECFWLDLANPEYAYSMYSKVYWGRRPFASLEVIQIAELFATIIDRMSRYTATHSRSVTGVAVLLAKHVGFCEEELYLMRVAGLLHDLGKLSVPNAILEKPGKLDKEELYLVRQHTYYTYRILQNIEHMETVAEWAACHHETLDGMGYPFRIAEDSLSLGARIMAVADIFVALAENRPYREQLGKEALSRIMLGMVSRHKISGAIVDLLLQIYPEAHAIVENNGARMPDFIGR